MVKISLIMPIYNGYNSIQKSIESVLNQSLKDIELILVNDGSVDDSLSICQSYVLKDDRIKLINKKNEGSGISRNRGISIARGKYLMFPDCDDWLDLEACKILYELAEFSNSDLVVCGSKNCIFRESKILKCYYTNPKSSFYNKDRIYNAFFDLLLIGVGQGPSNKLYLKSIIDRYNIQFPSLKRSQDIVFNMTYVDKITTMTTLDKPLYNYVVNNDSLLNKLNSDYFLNVLEVYNVISNISASWNLSQIKREEYKSRYLIEGLKFEILYLIYMKFTLVEIEENVNFYISSIELNTILASYHPLNLRDRIFKRMLIKRKFKFAALFFKAINVIMRIKNIATTECW